MVKPILATDLVAHGPAADLAEELAARVNAAVAAAESPAACWQEVAKRLTLPEAPFPAHLLLARHIYADWPASAGPAPLWLPAADAVTRSNLGRLMHERGFAAYADFHRWSVTERDAFWDLMIRRLGLRFHHPYAAVRDPASGLEAPRWLPGARLNCVDSCFLAPPDAPALIGQDHAHGPRRTLTYAELEALCNRVANGLHSAGFVPGDAIAILMPFTIEAAAIYLGIIRAGCAAVSITDSFAPAEIAVRLRITGTRAVFTQDVVLRSGHPSPLYARLLEAAPPRAVVVPAEPGCLQATLRPGDLAWDRFLSDNTAFASVPCEPDTVSNVLFSSGTTADPKAIPWTHTTPIKGAVDAYLHHDVQPGDVLTWPTSLGWMMGPWLLYAGLVNRATVALYGDVPTNHTFGAFVAEAGVTMLGLVPTLVRTWRHTRCMEKLDWSRIRRFSSTGECSNHDDMHYLMALAGYKPVIEYCGGTEIGGGFLTGTLIQPAAPAAFSTPALGSDFVLLDDDGQPTTNGELFVIPPSLGLSGRLLNYDHHEVYFADTPCAPGGVPLRRHGDQVEALGNGYFRHHGRADDTMKLKGIKMSSVEIERQLNHLPAIHETAAVAVQPADGGPSQLVIFVVLQPDATVKPGTLRPLCQNALTHNLNQQLKVHDVRVVERLPRTASNKIMRRQLRREYQAQAVGQRTE